MRARACSRPRRAGSTRTSSASSCIATSRSAGTRASSARNGTSATRWSRSATGMIPVALLLHRVALVPFLAELALVPALLDVAIQLDAELVRVEPARRGREHARARIGVVDHLRRGQRLLGEDLR